MKNIKIDIYKSIFLLILGVFVYCYYENSKIGRFVVYIGNRGGAPIVLDSKNGATYTISSNESPNMQFYKNPIK